MALADLLARLERRTVSPDTPRNLDEVTAKLAPLLACTLVTPDTPKIVSAYCDVAMRDCPTPFDLNVPVALDATRFDEVVVPLPDDEIPTSTCASCTHSRKPGGVSRYCSARPDLPPAYGEGHPLRQLPDDDGEGCGQWMNR
jgi:hypothetical protein